MNTEIPDNMLINASRPMVTKALVLEACADYLASIDPDRDRYTGEILRVRDIKPEELKVYFGTLYKHWWVGGPSISEIPAADLAVVSCAKKPAAFALLRHEFVSSENLGTSAFKSISPENIGPMTTIVAYGIQRTGEHKTEMSMPLISHLVSQICDAAENFRLKYLGILQAANTPRRNSSAHVNPTIRIDPVAMPRLLYQPQIDDFENLQTELSAFRRIHDEYRSNLNHPAAFKEAMQRLFNFISYIEKNEWYKDNLLLQTICRDAQVLKPAQHCADSEILYYANYAARLGEILQAMKAASDASTDMLAVPTVVYTENNSHVQTSVEGIVTLSLYFYPYRNKNPKNIAEVKFFPPSKSYSEPRIMCTKLENAGRGILCEALAKLLTEITKGEWFKSIASERQFYS